MTRVEQFILEIKIGENSKNPKINFVLKFMEINKTERSYNGLDSRKQVLTLKNLRGGQNDPLRFFWNNSRKKKDFSTKF